MINRKGHWPYSQITPVSKKSKKAPKLSLTILLKAAKSRTPPGCCWPRWRTSPWTRGSPLWREAGGRLAKEVDGLQGHWPPVQTSCSCTQSVWSQPPPPRGMIGPREPRGTMKTRKSGYVLNICARKWSTYLEPSHLVIVACFLGELAALGVGACLGPWSAVGRSLSRQGGCCSRLAPGLDRVVETWRWVATAAAAETKDSLPAGRGGVGLLLLLPGARPSTRQGGRVT